MSKFFPVSWELGFYKTKNIRQVFLGEREDEVVVNSGVRRSLLMKEEVRE